MSYVSPNDAIIISPNYFVIVLIDARRIITPDFPSFRMMEPGAVGEASLGGG
jgi:hypothetical protein